ncbi:MAG: NADP-dependent isocitrate dehydrogenase, partial [Corynebacterium casei]|nr:NADP-dependent isocitrate dehydrogenase [Corynebacterium casei]
ERLLTDGYSPSRKVKEIDNRGSHLYLAAFWAEELAKQTDDAELAEGFKEFSAKLNENLDAIAQELIDIQGQPADLGGYYWPNEDKTAQVMRPSSIYNEILESLKK